MVATGFPRAHSVKTEVIDLADETTTCEALEDHPIEVNMASGGLLNDRVPLICGGFEGVNRLIVCYIAGSANRDPVVKRLTPRSSSAAVTLNSHQLWITGGMDDSRSKYLKSTEIVDDRTSFPPVVKGPDLPVPMAGHCIVQLNQSTILFMGGAPNFKKTHFYNIETQTWTDGPDMNYGRLYSGCGMMQMATGSSVVVITGGRKTEALTRSTTEFLKLGDPFGLRWSRGMN